MIEGELEWLYRQVNLPVSVDLAKDSRADR